MDKATTAARIATVLNDYFVFDMPDIEDMIPGNMEQLSSLEGCYDIINQLLEIIQEAD